MSTSDPPHVVLVAGPNGAGKTTAASTLLPAVLTVRDYVNADVIATGLSGFDPESVGIKAGRLMLDRLHELAAHRANFAFETTLASRSFAPMLRKIIAEGYHVHILFLWPRTPDIAVERVRQRVLAGGHRVPDDVVQRRYVRGLANFFELYRPLAHTWRFYDNGGPRPLLVASGQLGEPDSIHLPSIWADIRREGEHEHG